MTELIILCFLFVIGLGVFLIVWKLKRERTVLENSSKLKRLSALNVETKRKLSPSYDLTLQIDIRCKSKADFDGSSLKHCLSRYMAMNYKTYTAIYDQVVQDREVYQSYMRKYEAIKATLGNPTIHDCIPREQFLELEARLFEKYRLPSPQFRLDVRKTYISPKKRNHYHDQGYFYAHTFIDLCEALYAHEGKKKAFSKERRRMTNDLRYQILKRDSFRCQVCGRTQADGTILHIDHILPVSKGGKTIPSNLRVLCAACNLGKSDSYDPNGLN